jgi:beta-glucanase (GH16 family)
VEARIQLPGGWGTWPAFWMMPDDQHRGWPACGEIDIMEYRGQAPSIVHGSLHGPGYSGGGALTSPYTLSGQSFDADFHVFTVDWERDRLTWYVDGKIYKVVTPDDLPAGTRWVFDHPFFIILDLAVGGNFVGPPNAATSFPQAMLVDWVRVYRSTS